MPIQKILVVEDDLDMQEMIVSFLQKNGYMVSAAKNAIELLKQIKSNKTDLILLDVMLGDDNGINLCKQIRKENNIPIIIVSALSADQDRLQGFEVGADDYISKPFNPQILLAKIKAILKRGTKIASLAYRRNTKSYHFDEWIYDGKKDIIISPSGFQVSLSQKETKILKVFLANSHIALSREEIANAIDDTREQEKALDNLESRAIDVLVGRLRTKIEKDTKKPSLIKTERGVGYIFSCEVITKDE
ncbi:response regulator transcription factor [Alphaproteobacteria bacterium]|nr:response regulator transcription factor [Alphaproteobacteria bacterium]